MKTQLSRPLVSLALPLLVVLLSLTTVAAAQVIELKLTASDGAEGDIFGWSVSLSSDHALIGTPPQNPKNQKQIASLTSMASPP